MWLPLFSITWTWFWSYKQYDKSCLFLFVCLYQGTWIANRKEIKKKHVHLPAPLVSCIFLGLACLKQAWARLLAVWLPLSSITWTWFWSYKQYDRVVVIDITGYQVNDCLFWRGFYVLALQCQLILCTSNLMFAYITSWQATFANPSPLWNREESVWLIDMTLTNIYFITVFAPL